MVEGGLPALPDLFFRQSILYLLLQLIVAC
jgi:hypothetical protein